MNRSLYIFILVFCESSIADKIVALLDEDPKAYERADFIRFRQIS